MSVFCLPDLGEGLSEAEIVAWHVAVGDSVVPDQPLLAVESDKAVVEIPSAWRGRVAKLHAAPGDVVKVGAPLIEFDEAARADQGTVVGSLPPEATPTPAAGPPASRPKVSALPNVRALARTMNVDLSAVDPTGPDGTITVKDVERAASAFQAIEAAEPLRGVRRVMAQKMALAHAEVAAVSVYEDADVDSWPAGTDVTIRLARAIAAACRAQPSLNAWYDSQKAARRLLERIDLGIAVATEDGLFVPVLRDVANRDDADLRRGLDAMKRDVAARKIPHEEMRGATITLSNFGLFRAGRFASMVVLPPQVAIVGAGRILPRVVADEGRPAVHRLLPLSLTFDHRVVAGAEAVGFLRAMIEDLSRVPPIPAG